MVKRIFKWVHCLKFQGARRRSGHQAVSRAFGMVVNGQLAPHRAISSVARRKLEV